MRRGGEVVMTGQRKLLLKTLEDVGGRIEDKRGQATGLLAELMYPEKGEYNPQSLVSFLQNAEKDGLIFREIQGRRTFVISLNPNFSVRRKSRKTIKPEAPVKEPISVRTGLGPPLSQPEPSTTSEPTVDYRRIADELLDLVLERATNKAPDQTEEIARLSRSLRDEMSVVQTQKHLINQLQDEIKALKSEQFSFRQQIKGLEEHADKLAKAAAQNGGRVYNEAKQAVLNNLMAAPKHVNKGD